MKIKWSLFFLLLASARLPLGATSNSILFSLKSPRTPTALEISLWSLGMIGAYHLINYSAQAISFYIENKIIDTIADSITLACTPKGVLCRTVPLGKEDEALQKKARYAVLRVAVLQKLENLLANPNTLSQEQNDILRNLLKNLDFTFKTIDQLRLKTDYEKFYQMAWIDHYIVGQIVNSIVLTTKPYHECTPHELHAKQLQKERREKITKKLSTNVLTTLYLIFNPVFRNYTTASWL